MSYPQGTIHVHDDPGRLLAAYTRRDYFRDQLLLEMARCVMIVADASTPTRDLSAAVTRFASTLSETPPDDDQEHG